MAVVAGLLGCGGDAPPAELAMAFVPKNMGQGPEAKKLTLEGDYEQLRGAVEERLPALRALLGQRTVANTGQQSVCISVTLDGEEMIDTCVPAQVDTEFSGKLLDFWKGIQADAGPSLGERTGRTQQSIFIPIPFYNCGCVDGSCICGCWLIIGYPRCFG